MRFSLTREQADFGRALDGLLAGAGTAAVARAWAAGDAAPGLALWAGLTAQGVPALAVPEEHGGLAAGRGGPDDPLGTATELVVAFEALGRHVVPGPWVEAAAYLPLACADGDLLAALAEGAVATVAAPPRTPYALDGAVADRVLTVADGRLHRATAGTPVPSVDTTRLLCRVDPGEPVVTGDLVAAGELATLATAAQLLGLGERLLADTVAYVQQRRQFGRVIGSYQALKHRLADGRVALDFARPLVHGAAIALGSPTAPRDVAAAKLAAAEAAYAVSRTALQLHGAVGYTRELDLSLAILKVRALVAAWGTPAEHRAVVLEALLAEAASGAASGAAAAGVGA